MAAESGTVNAGKAVFARLVLAAATAGLFTMAGCRSGDGSLPPVFGAVFGAEGARSVPYQVGKLPDPAVRPGDRIVGDAANNPGQCIYRTPNDRRYRAPCPEGYAIGDVN